jgi:signal transduction histidine kinase
MLKRLNLFHRIFLHGVLLITALALAVIITFHAADDAPNNWFEAFARSASLMSKEVARRNEPQTALKKQVETLNFVTHTNLAVYTKDGVLLSRAGDASILPLSADDVNSLFTDENTYRHVLGKLYIPIRSSIEPSYMIVVLHGHSEMLSRFIFGLIIALLIIGAVSFPVARSIAKPIQSITRTALRLKDGDLDARVDIDSSGELGMLASALNDMALVLKARIHREKELLANVSHELRTPLARMRVALEIVDETDCAAECTKRHLKGITADVAELEQLVNDVLSAVRLDLTGKETALPLRLEEVSIGKLLHEAKERFLRRSDRSLVLEAASNECIAVLDKTLFLRVIDNLIDNADKYSPQDTELTLTMYTKDNHHIVEVSDRGEGIIEADLQRVFEPFYRCDKSRSKNIGGIGLGLTLCKKIVEALGGTIAALPRDGGGTVMRIRLLSSNSA